MALSVQAGLPATNFGNTIDNEARKTVYAGSLKAFVSNNVDDRIAARTASAKKDAMRLISDAWKRNEAIHKDIPAPSPEEMARRRKLYCIAGNMPEE